MRGTSSGIVDGRLRNSLPETIGHLMSAFGLSTGDLAILTFSKKLSVIFSEGRRPSGLTRIRPSLSKMAAAKVIC